MIGIIGIFLVFLGTFGLWIMKPGFGGDEFAFYVGSLFIGTVALFLMLIIWIFTIALRCYLIQNLIGAPKIWLAYFAWGPHGRANV